MAGFFNTNAELLKAIGLGDQYVKWADIRIRSGSIPTVLVELEVVNPDGSPVLDDNSEIITVLREFELIPKES